MKLNPTQPLLAALVTGMLALAAMLPARADYSNAVMSLNPVGYWRLNETAFPVLVYPPGTATNIGSLGVIANGTYFQDPLTQQPGALTTAGDANPAVLFDYPDEYVSIPYHANFNPPGSFTVEFWANVTNAPTATVSTLSPLCNLGTSGATTRFNGYVFFSGNGNGNSQWTFRTYVGTTRYNVLSASGTVVLNQWTHVVGVHDGSGQGTNYLYLDGVLAGSLTPALCTPQTSTWPMTVGNGPNDGEALTFPFPGFLDDLAIYTNALSAAQVAAHYAAGTTPAASPTYKTLVQTTDAAAGYWRFDDPSLPPRPTPPPAKTATNLGSMGSLADGVMNYSPGLLPGVAGVPFTGFESTNKACYFNGSAAAEINCGNNPGFDFPTAVSIAVWVKSDGNLSFMAAFNKGNTLWRLQLHRTQTNMNWTYPGGDVIGTASAADGQWHHLVAVAGPAGGALYVDGRPDGTNVSPFSGATDTKPVSIGSPNPGTSARWKGTIDEAALFDRELSAAEVLNLYTQATGPEAKIVAFGANVRPSRAVIGAVVNNAATIAWTVPYGTVVAGLAPSFALSAGATCNQPNGAIPTPNFGAGPVAYKVISGGTGTTNVYTVTVTVAAPAPLFTMALTGYGTNGTLTETFNAYGTRFQTEGWDLTVNWLGLFDAPNDDVTGTVGDGLQGDHLVSIWQEVEGTLVARTTVLTTDELVGNFRGNKITPVTLNGYTSYVIAADYGGTGDRFLSGANLAQWGVYSGISQLEGRYGGAGGGFITFNTFNSIVGPNFGYDRPILGFAQNGDGTFTLTWTNASLLEATNVMGPWTTNLANPSPYMVTPDKAVNQKYYRLQSP